MQPFNFRSRHARKMPHIFFFVAWWLTFGGAAFAQEECIKLKAVFEGDKSSPGKLLAGCLLEQQVVLNNLLDADRPNSVAVLSSGSHSSGDSDHTFSVELERPGILVFSGSATGRLVHPNQPFHNADLRVRLFIDGAQCASDYYYFSPVSGIRYDVGASCTRLLRPGKHKFRVLMNERGITDDKKLTADFVVIERAE